MDRIFIDSSVIVKHCMDGDELLTTLILKEYGLAASPNVMEESFYKCLFLRTEVLLGKSGIHNLRAAFTKNPDHYDVIFSYYKDFLGALVESGVISILDLNERITFSSFDISYTFCLLPNDALIAATCKFYGIKKIATFDKDFEKVDFLEILRLVEEKGQ